jgi:diguanylate cyclase (GGDEF)-like protein/PAS domain S-box-containing protein
MAGHETNDGDSLVAPGTPGSWITAEIAVPLVERERVAGVLVIGGTREQPLHRADLTLAETIAEYLAMAIGRTRLHEEAREIGRSYQAVVERVREVIFHLRTEDLAIVFLNPAWTLRLGYPEGSHLGQSLLDVVFPDDRARLEAALKSLATNTIGALMTETRVLTADGEVVWMELRARSDIRSIDEPEITGMLVDITERRKYEEALLQSNDLFRSLAFHDPLTGLPNRLVFNDRLEHALAVSGRRGTGVAVLFLDLDGFKPVNDRYGHAAGDRALEIVGARFAENVRDGDTIARLGGDEFGIVLEDLENDAEAKRVAAAVIALMQTPIDLGHAEVTVGVSIGITYIAGRAITVAGALAEADTALYRAKRSGGGRFSG